MIIKNISFETASFIYEFVMNGKSLSVKVQKQLVYPSVISGYLLYFGYVRKDTEQIISSIKKLYKKRKDDMHHLLFDKNKRIIYNVTSE